MQKLDDVLIDRFFQPMSDVFARLHLSCFTLARMSVALFVVCNLLGFYFGTTRIYASRDPVAILITMVYVFSAWRSVGKAEHFVSVLGENPQRMRAMLVRTGIVLVGVVSLLLTPVLDEDARGSDILFLGSLWLLVVATEYFMSCTPPVVDLGAG